MTDTAYDVLCGLLEDDLKQISQLQEVLERERQCLVSREFTSLPTIVADKERLSSQVDENNRSKRDLIDTFLDKHARSSGGLAALMLQEFGQARFSHLEALNKNLETKLAECRQMNAVNGVVIAKTEEAQREVLDIVSGNQRIGQVYNAAGQMSDSDREPNFKDKV